MAPFRELGRWVRLLQWAERGLVAVAVLLGAFAVVMIVSDESDHDDDWDGFGTFFGLILGGFAALLVVLAGILLALTATGWRRAQDRSAMGLLRGAAVMAAAMALGWLPFAVVLVSDLEDVGLAVAILLPVPLLVWPASMVLIESIRASASAD